MGLPFPSTAPTLSGQVDRASAPPSAAPLPTRDPQRPPTRPQPLNIGGINDSPEIRRNLDYLRDQPAYQQFFRDYERAIRDGTPLPQPPQLNLPPQTNQRPATFPTLEAARESRPQPPARSPMPRTFMRGANEAGRMPDEIRLSSPGQPPPAPADPIPPRRPAPLPWQQPAGSTGRRVQPLDLAPNPEQVRLNDYVSNHPLTQEYLREYERALRENRPPPPAPRLPEMPPDYQPRYSSPSSTADPRRPSPRPSPPPFAPPTTRPATAPALPSPAQPAPAPPRSPSPTPATPAAPRPAPPASNPAPARTAPTPGRPARSPGAGRRVPGLVRSPLSRMPIPIPIPEFAPPETPPPFVGVPILGPTSRAIDTIGDFLVDLFPGMNLADQAGTAAGQALARRLRPDLRRPPEGPQLFPPPEIALPQTWDYSYAIITRDVRSSPTGNFTPLSTRIPAQGDFIGLVTFNREFTQSPRADDGSYSWSDRLVWRDATRTGAAVIYSGVIFGNQTAQPTDFYRNVRVIPYIIRLNSPTPTQLPDWQPTAPTAPNPRPVNPFSPFPSPPSSTAPSPPPSPFAPVVPAIMPAAPGQPSPRPSPPASTPAPGGSGRPGSAPGRGGPRWASIPGIQPNRNTAGLPNIPFTPPGGSPLSCRFRDDPYSQAIRNDTIAANQKLDQLLGLIGDAGILARINSFESNMNNRLGPQMQGGISGVLRNFAKSNLVQSFLNALTFITALHNAFMLSNNLRLTLFSAFDLIYELPGMARFAPTDPETGERVDYGTWAADQFDTLLRAAFGDQTVDTVRTNWNKASRVYQAATNLLFAMQSIMWSIQEALEVVGQYVAWIGNALKKYGVVSERAYGWMNPNAANSRRFSRFYNFMQQAQEQTENLEQIAGATLDVTESAAELTRQSNEFNNALRGLTTDGTQPDPNFPSELPYSNLPEPQPIVDNETAAAEAAQNTTDPIPPEQEQRPTNDQ